MAEHAVNSMASARTGELTSRVFSGLIQRYGKDAAISGKLQELEMLLIKIHSTVEASEKHNIDNSWLLRWRDKLKEAASQGDEVLARFLKRAKDIQGTSNARANQQQGEATSSSSAAATAVRALSFTRNSLSSIVQGIRSARKMLFVCGDDDMEMLNKTLARLEKLSPDIGEFIRLLRLETLLKTEQTPSSTALSSKVHGSTAKIMKRRKKTRMQQYAIHANPSSEPSLLSFSPPKEEKIRLRPPTRRSAVRTTYRTNIQVRLEAVFTEICKAVELADSHDLEDLEWLAYWAGILRVAKEQGRDVLSTTRACKTVNTKDNNEPVVEFDQKDDGLLTFVHRLEGLARDVEYFSKLVYPVSGAVASCYYC
ncbi:unnamed protein product [Alopecurus aequalis]